MDLSSFQGFFVVGSGVEDSRVIDRFEFFVRCPNLLKGFSSFIGALKKTLRHVGSNYRVASIEDHSNQ